MTGTRTCDGTVWLCLGVGGGPLAGSSRPLRAAPPAEAAREQQPGLRGRGADGIAPGDVNGNPTRRPHLVFLHFPRQLEGQAMRGRAEPRPRRGDSWTTPQSHFTSQRPRAVMEPPQRPPCPWGDLDDAREGPKHVLHVGQGRTPGPGQGGPVL